MKITESPIEEIVVHEVYKLSMQSLLIKRIRPDGRAPLLYWCNGIIYFFGVFSDPEIFDQEFMKGKFHFTEVYYSEMEKYNPIVELNTDQFGGVKISVIDQGDIPLHKELTSWLKSKKVPKK